MYLNQSAGRFLAASVFALLCGISAGCSQPAATGQKGESPAPPESNVARQDAGSKEAGNNEAVSKGETVVPVKSLDTPVKAEKLLGSIPQDKLPKPGPDGASARDAANTWLTQQAVGQLVEVTFRIEDIEITGGEQNDTLHFTPIAMGQNDIRERLSGGISADKTTTGGHPCHIKVTGPEPTWKNVPRSQSEKYESLKGKVVKFRGKIVSGQFMAEGNGPLSCFLELAELQPQFESKPAEVAGKTTAPQDDKTTEKPAKAADAALVAAADQAIKQMPKALSASEMPAQPAIASGIDKLMPPDEFFPVRRVIGPEVDGKHHGEFRAYAPNRQLIYLQPFDQNKPHGLQRTFYPSGRPFGMMNFVQGKVDGHEFKFYETGQLRAFSTWKDGVQDGPTALFYDNGKMALMYEMKQGKAEGLQYHYLPSGPLHGIVRMEYGKQVAIEKVLGGVNSNFLSIDSLGNIERQLNSRSYILKDYWTGKSSSRNKPVKVDHKTGEWKSLFNGKDLVGWWPQLDKVHESSNPLDQLSVWEVKDGILRGTPQKTAMYLISDECFSNFHLRAEVRIDDKSDAGISFGIPNVYTGYHTMWNEVQIATKHDYFFTGGVHPTPQTSNRTKNPLLHKPGEWFTLEVIAQGKHVVTKVNGTVVADVNLRHEKYDPLGHIGLQLRRVPPPPVRGRRAGDEPIDPTAKVEFRKLEIMPLAD